jgi:hypothetical protein
MAGGPPPTRSEYNVGRSLISLNTGVPRSSRFLQGAGLPRVRPYDKKPRLSSRLLIRVVQ